MTPALSRRNARRAPLSFAQERLWFIDAAAPGSATYNVPLFARWTEPVDTAALATALAAVARRHEVLRTTYRLSEGEPVQLVGEPGPVPVESVRVEPGPDAWDRVREDALRHARVPFDLTTEPPFRCVVWHGGPGVDAVLLCVHHIAVDGWSLAPLYRDLADAYEAALAGRAPALPELPLQYTDFAAWDRAVFDEPDMRRRLADRAEELRAIPGELTLGDLDGQRGEVVDGQRRGDRYVFDLSPALSSGVEELATSLRATPFVLLFAAFQAVVRRWAGREEFLVGAVMANRSQPELEDVAGFFVNTVPLRCRVLPDRTFRQLCGDVRTEAYRALSYQRIPFDQLTAAARANGQTGLATVGFALQNMPAPRYSAEPKWTSPEVLPTGTAKSDLLLQLEEGPGGLTGIVEYDVDRYSAETAKRLAENFATLLAAAVAEPDSPVSRLPITERAPGTYPPGVLVGPQRDLAGDALARLGAEKPAGLTTVLDVLAARLSTVDLDGAAVRCGGREMSWRELDRVAWRVAAALAGHVGGPDIRFVPTIAARGGHLAAAWVGALRAGAAYAPLSVDTPPDRVRYILDEVGATVVLADKAGAALLGDLDVDVQVLRIDLPDTTDLPERPEPVVHHHDVPALVLYTSGTTGRPKGVVLGHRGLLNTVLWWSEEFDVGPGDRVMCPWSTQFDAASFDTFRSLLSGSLLIFADDVERRDPPALVRLVRGPRGATVTSMTPALLRAMLDADDSDEPSTLRALSVGGEVVSPRMVADCARRWDVRMHHIYGPTEVSCLSTGWWVERTDERLPIGAPIPNTRAYVLGPQQEELPPGVPGELCMAGAGVGLGYLGRPERTAVSFVPDPFAPEPNARMYRTGDRAAIRDDGTLAFLGRFDDQVKIVGNRIEPAEVAKLLEEQPAVRTAAVHPEGEPARLVAYVVLADPGALPTRDELVRPLLRWLPPPVLPVEVYVVDALPLNGNDKIDFRALREMRSARLPHAVPAEAELTADERRAAELLAEVLTGAGAEVDAARLRPESNFFTIGGHSLLAVNMIAEAGRRWGVEIALRDFLTEPTVGGLAGLLGAAGTVRADDFAGQQRYPATSVQQRLWFLDRVGQLRRSYLVPTVLEFTGPVDRARLREAVESVLARHPALRSRFELDKKLRQVFYRTDGAPPVVTSSDSSDFDDLAEHVTASCWTPFDLATEAPARAEIIADGERTLLLLVSHHLVFDGWSRQIVFDQLVAAYLSGVDDLPAPVHPAELAVAEAAPADDAIARLRGAPTDVELPGRRARSAVQECEGATSARTFGAELTAKTRRVLGELGCSTFVLAAALLAAALARRGGQRDFLFAFPWAGRDTAASVNAVGMFVNTLVLRVDLRDEPTWRELLVRVREETKACYRDADVPFDALAAALHPDRDLSRPPLTPVYLGAFDGHAAAPGIGPDIRSRLLPLDRLEVKYELDLTATDLGDDLEIAAVYAAPLLSATTVAALLADLVACAEDLTANPDAAVL
ncbi:amino acid adenylation domain-containing protein [Amycolatopsis lurida]